MRIENNYFAEDLKEGNVSEEIAAPEAQPARASDPEFVTWFVKSLAESRASTRAQKLGPLVQSHRRHHSLRCGGCAV